MQYASVGSARPPEPTNTARRRIALLLPDLRGGGAERVCVNIANELCRRSYAVDVVLTSATGAFLPLLDHRVAIVDLHAHRLRQAFLPLVQYLRRTRPDAMLACMWPLTVIALAAQRVARVSTRMVVAEHTTWSDADVIAPPPARRRARVTMRVMFRLADAVVAVSDGAADALATFARLPRHSIATIYNPIVERSLPPATTAHTPRGWWTGPHRRVLAVGTLKPVKDHFTLISAFAELRKRADARLLILGEGECRRALEAHVRAVGLNDCVFLPGFVPDPTPYYGRADLHVLSSLAEGLSNVIIEALAAGTPVVSTDCPSGPREILQDGRIGSLVPVRDPGALAEAMLSSLTRSHDSAALRARAMDFSVEKAVDRYEQLLLPGLAIAGRK